jgi:hypothetical protein
MVNVRAALTEDRLTGIAPGIADASTSSPMVRVMV